MTELLLASGGWVLDLVFFLLLILGTAYGAYKGFVAGICKLAGKWASLIFAVTFCISFSNFLELCFGMTSGITRGIAQSIANNPSYDVGIPTEMLGANVGDFFTDINGIARWFISKSFAEVVLPTGTTAAVLIASVLAKWISVVISFILLIILVRLGALLLSKTFNAIKNKILPLRAADLALGAILGLAKACFFIFVLLLICNWLPFQGLQDFIGSSSIVGKIYVSEWFQSATSYAVSGQWFYDYLKR